MYNKKIKRMLKTLDKSEKLLSRIRKDELLHRISYDMDVIFPIEDSIKALKKQLGVV